MFASFGPRDEALTLPRVIREPARVRNSRRERAPCGSIERRTPGSSVGSARRTFGEASNARCTTGGRCVLCVVARLRVRRTIETESESPFLPSGSALQVLFHGSKKVRASSSRRRAVFPDSMRTCAAFVNAKFPKTGFQFDTEIDAELAGGAAEFFFSTRHRFRSLPTARAKKNKNWDPGERSVVDRCIFGEIDRAPFALSRWVEFAKESRLRSKPRATARERLLSRTKSEATRPNASPSRRGASLPRGHTTLCARRGAWRIRRERKRGRACRGRPSP